VKFAFTSESFALRSLISCLRGVVRSMEDAGEEGSLDCMVCLEWCGCLMVGLVFASGKAAWREWSGYHGQGELIVELRDKEW
jgi:hypothetical protein